MFLFKKIFVFIFTEKGREGERDSKGDSELDDSRDGEKWDLREYFFQFKTIFASAGGSVN